MKLKSPILTSFFILLIIVLSFSIFNIYDLITKLGHHIPQTKFAEDYFIALLWAFFFFVVILMLPLKREDSKALLILWGVRCFVTLFFMLVYEYIYPLDAYVYFSVAKADYFDTSMLRFGNGTGWIMWLSWFFNHKLPIFDSYHALKVVYSFLGLCGCYIFYRAFILYFGEKKIVLLYLLGLYPSVLFWSSILGKDPMVFFGISIYTLGVLGFLKDYKLKNIFLIALGVGISSLIRVWTAPILIAPILFVVIFGTKTSAPKKILYSLIAIAAFGFSINLFLAMFNIESTQSLVESSSSIATSWGIGGSGQTVKGFSSIGDMIKFAPKGMFAALFRPLPFEVFSLFGLVAGFENFFTLILLYLAFKNPNKELFKESGVIWAISLILIWSFIYGFASYQNLGTASRFKLQVYPVLLTLLFYFIYSKKKLKEFSEAEDS